MRTRTTWQAGEKHPKAKLSAEQVTAIDLALRQGATHRDLADVCGVSRVAITDINRGMTWAHVTGRRNKGRNP